MHRYTPYCSGLTLNEETGKFKAKEKEPYQKTRGKWAKAHSMSDRKIILGWLDQQFLSTHSSWVQGHL